MSETAGNSVSTPEMAGGVERFWNHLDEVSRHNLLEAEERAETGGGWTSKTAFIRRHPWAVAGMAALLTIGAGAVIYALLSRKKASPVSLGAPHP